MTATSCRFCGEHDTVVDRKCVKCGTTFPAASDMELSTRPASHWLKRSADRVRESGSSFDDAVKAYETGST